MRLRLETIVGLCIVIFWPTVAAAYCRTTTCANSDAETRPKNCLDDPYRCETGGKPIMWPQNCTSFSVQQDGSKKFGITAGQLQEVVRSSFDNWQNVDCPGGGKPNVYVEAYPQVACDKAVVNMHGRNQNVWVFHDDVWPDAARARTTLALTTMSFRSDSGEIYDADVQLNSANFQFALDSEGPGTDLRSVIQHESGHVLGLADLYDQGSLTSTMYWDYSVGHRLAKRTLEADDIAGLCSVFPPVSKPSECNPEPRNGFSTLCHEAMDDGGCSCSLWRSSHGGSKTRWSWLLIGMTAAAARARGAAAKHGRRRVIR